MVFNPLNPFSYFTTLISLASWYDWFMQPQNILKVAIGVLLIFVLFGYGLSRLFSPSPRLKGGDCRDDRQSATDVYFTTTL